MAVDALIALQASVTKVATFNGAALILPGGTPRRGMVCRVIYSAAGNASGANAVVFSVDVCYDGVPTLWLSDFLAPPINLVVALQAGELFIPFSISPTMVAGVITAPQIRLTSTFSGAGATPTITYQGDLSLTRP
jgi:hypothetical protein